LYFLFNQHTALSSRAEVGHLMYSGVPAVGEALLIHTEISHTVTLNFIGFQKVQNLASFLTSLNLSRPRWKMQQDIWILNQSC